MTIQYEVISEDRITFLKDLCNELMAYQKSKASIRPELFDGMCFETRMVPSVQRASANYIKAVKDGEEIVGYVYSNISPQETYSNEFATLFDLDSVRHEEVDSLGV
ncbi:MAG TPA: hypothetical protein VE710_23850 [Candidatus Bathyarchaeia archaeon]|nr:hypothetical protein [Candidatus Bathyarchaeia archaeon]